LFILYELLLICLNSHPQTNSTSDGYILGFTWARDKT
jgi:hypothetical protein